MVLHQPSFIMVPVKLLEPWYEDSGVQLIQEIKNELSRERRFLGVLMAGLMAPVSIIATAAAIALSQTVQTAHFVNNLSKNVTMALGTQESIDRKLEAKINALYDTLNLIGGEIESIHIRLQLSCHANYEWICVSPKKYNDSNWAWKKVQRHLRGIWHNANESLDMIQLHREIQEMINTRPLRANLAEEARSFLNQLLTRVPTIESLQHTAIGLACTAALVLLIFCLASVLLKRLAKALLSLGASVHEIKLHLKKKKGGAVGSDLT